MYDSCQFQRCTRLIHDPPNNNNNNNNNTWRELALWLWEVHNDVNVRLYHERLSDNGEEAIDPTSFDDQKVKWPSVAACPNCWHSNGSWNETEIYQYLEQQYWPSHYTSNIDIARKDMESIPENQPPPNIWHNVGISLSGLGLIYFVMSRRKRVFMRSRWCDGKHKKPC